MSARVPIDRARIGEFCKQHRIRKLSLFGSVLRDDFRPDSDVDILVEFQPGQVVDFIHFYEVERELSELFGGRKLDLVTPKFLSHRIKDHILAEAEVQYEEG